MIRYQKSVRYFAICLSAVAGYVDAVGFIALGGFFVSFMSGNSTRLGVGLAGGSQDAAIAGGLIVSFVLGVVVGSATGSVAGARRPGAILCLTACLLMAASAWRWPMSGRRPWRWWPAPWGPRTPCSSAMARSASA